MIIHRRVAISHVMIGMDKPKRFKKQKGIPKARVLETYVHS